MNLPRGFEFSQGSLQDYVDCPRRFHLRYVRGQRWPAVETSPILESERRVRKGAAFHRLVRQHLMGVPEEELTETVGDPEVARWWDHYLDDGPVEVARGRYPEMSLRTRLGDYGLVARYDLVSVDAEGRVAIVDWKTSRKRPRRAWLSERLQTHVYPFVMASAGASLPGLGRVRVGKVVMIYWFANAPARPERFGYDSGRFEADRLYLLELVEEVTERLRMCTDGEWLPATEDEGRCRLCRYRSLCRPGVESGYAEEMEGDVGWFGDLDLGAEFEQVLEGEIG